MNKKSLRTGVLNTPYVIWSALFIIIPLIFVAYYSFFDNGKFTLEFIAKFTEKNNQSAFWLSVLLSLGATVISLIVA